MRALAEHSADVNKQNNEGATPLWCASRMGFESMVRCLLSLGALPETPGAPADVQPEAIAKGHPKIAEILRQAIAARAADGELRGPGSLLAAAGCP